VTADNAGCPAVPNEAAAAVSVSVVVTTKNSGRTLEACLASVRSQSHPAVQLVLVDNSSTDDTLDLAAKYCDVVATIGPERSAQRNHGASLSDGEILMFIDSDMVLDTEIVAQGVQALVEPAVRAVVFPEESFGDDFWTQVRILERSCLNDDDRAVAARMYRRADFEESGGFDLELNGPEDWDLSRRIARGTAMPRTTAMIRHNEGRTTLRGAFVKRRYYAPGYLRYLEKHGRAVLGQANPVLRPAFFRHWRELGRHPVLTAGIFVLKSAELGAVLQVAVEQKLLGRTRNRAGQVYQGGAPAVGTHAGGHRPLIVTFGSVVDAHGGVQTRARVTAETFSDLGLPAQVVSTREAATTSEPPWAERLVAPTRKPFRGFSPSLVRLISRAGADSSVVVITNAMLLPAFLAARTGKPLVWDTNECQTLHYRRLPHTVGNLARLAVWWILERWATRRCTVAIAISSEEAITWRKVHPELRDKLCVVDHAAMVSPRDNGAAREVLTGMVGAPLDGPVLLFLGSMRAKHNAAAAAWIRENLVSTLAPDATLVFCGPGTERLPEPTDGGARVVALGAVDDVDSVVAAADLCLAPLAAGAGVKTKVLHYLSHGRPVAGTPTAFEGIDGAPGILVAPLDELAAVVKHACQTVEDPRSAASRSAAQMRWVDEHHGRSHIAAQWREVLGCLPTSSTM
jgi:hypothetical protein